MKSDKFIALLGVDIIMEYILNYLKKILILTLANLIIVILVYLIKNQFVLHNIGHGLFVGGITMFIIGGLAMIGSAKTSEINAKNTYIAGYNGDKFGSDYIKDRNKNMNFTLLMLSSGLISIIIGYMIL